ncbi:MAG: hypothetical protein EOM66_00880 [Clostridia bacterium]|nr:hypothetical protein [Clostridia bacterium]
MEELCRMGKVISLSGKTAVVRFMRSDACGHCNACFHLGSQEADIEIVNTADAEVGDVVSIELRGSSMVRASLIMYGIPLIGLLAGVLVGAQWGDLYAAVGGIVLCAGTYFILRGLEPRFSRMNQFKPRMLEIIERSKDNG